MTTPVAPESITQLQEFALRQVSRILARGGSNLDVARYLKHFGQVKTGLQNVVEAAPEVDLQTPEPGKLAGLSMAAWQGLTFGFGDEALGGIAGLATLATGGGIEKAAQRVENTTEGFRNQMETFRGQHPALTIAGNIAGAVASPITRGLGGLAPAGAGAGLATRVGSLAAGGAAGGALAGAGEATGGISERAKSSLGGGIAGAIAGPIFGELIGAGAKGVQALARTGLGQALASRMGVWAGEMGEVTTNAQQKAREILAKAIVKGGNSIDDMLARSKTAERLGVPMNIADVESGDEILAVGLAAQGLRGEAKRALADQLFTRQVDQGARMIGALSKSMFRSSRLGLKNAYEAVEVLAQRRNALAAPMYREAYFSQVNVTEKMRKILAEPEIQDAYMLAKNAADLEDRLATSGTQFGLAVPDITTEAVTDYILPIRGLDMMKQTLDDVIARGSESGNVIPAHKAHALKGALNELLAEIDAQSPAYAAARGIYRSHSELMDAVAQGKGGKRIFGGQEFTTPRFKDKPPEVITRELEGLKKGKFAGTSYDQLVEAYRLGALQDLSDWVSSHTGELPNEARRVFGGHIHGTSERAMQQRMRALFVDDPQTAQDVLDMTFNETIASERGLGLIAATAGPSLEKSPAAAALLRAGVSIPLKSRGGLVSSFLQLARRSMSEEVSDEVSNLLAQGLEDPGELTILLQSLRPYVRAYQAQGQQRAARAAAGGAIGVGIGTTIVPH